MKRTFAILSALVLICLSASAQEVQTRALSRYADDKFGEDDKYSVEQPYQTVTVSQPKGKKVKNIIVMIGDGMGLEPLSCGWVLNGGRLNIDNFIYTGISRTYALDRLITDSCAGGSGISSQKTNYGYMACDAEGNPVKTLLEIAQEKGKKTGVAVTCRINDATPADFCCHSTDRDDEEGIAAQYLDSGVDFISGGGLRFWTERSDGRNLVEEMKAKGYTYVDDPAKIADAEGDRFLGLFAETEMEPALDRGPILEDCAVKALDMLDNKKGFFLMIEGSCIDDHLHHQKVGYAAEELFDFDRTIGKVLEWAEKDGQTLVIVTADHATGGLTLVGGSLEERSVKVHFSTSGHNGITVPVFAYGPHASDFVGFYENGDIAAKIRNLLK